MKTLSLWFIKDFWLTTILVYVLVGAVLSFLEYFLSYRLRPVYKRKNFSWHLAVAESLHLPAQIYIALMVFLLSIPKLLEPIGVNIGSLKGLGIFEHLVSVIFVFWFIMRIIKRMEASFHRRITEGVVKVLDKTQISAFAQIGRVIVILLFLLVLLPIFGIPTATLLTFGGASTIVIGFATKDIMANFINGLMIYWDRPFSVGDWISSPDKEIEGTVEDIGWRLTRIRTFDKRPLYVPNALFSTISIQNPSRMTHRRIKTNIGVRYSDASRIPAMLKSVQKMLENHSEIDTKETLMVNIFELGESGFNFSIYSFTKTTNSVKFEAIKQDVLLKTYQIMHEHGVDCPTV
jgi:MscS family membrane protein